MKRATRSVLVVAAVSVASLFAASGASANTYCAVTSGALSGCTTTYTGASTAVNDALNQASSNPGPDKVLIGSGTFLTPNNSQFSYNGGGPNNNVEIQGQGPSTILQNQGNPAADYVLILFGGGTAVGSVHDLKVNIPSTAGANVNGIVVSTGLATDIHDVTVTAPSPLNGTVGVSLGSPGSVLRNSTIDIARVGVATQPTFGAVSAVTSTSNVPVIRDSTISADYGIATGSSVSSPDEQLVASGLKITATTGVYSEQAGHITVDDTLIRLLPDVVSPGLYDSSGISSYSFLSGTAQITARHITVVGGAGTRDVGAQAYASDPGANVDLLLTNSVLSNVETSLKRVTSPGQATLSAEYSDYDPAPAKVVSTNSGGGVGIISQGPGNVNVVPGFTNAAGGDFSLASSSPLIDVGDAAALAGGEPATDLAGNPRVADGNADGTARRDIGAYEFTPAPTDTAAPDTIAGKFKKKVKKGKSATFRFSSDDPTASFTCAYDDGSAKACSSPYTLKRLKKGKHTLTIEAFDAAGNHDASPLVNKFKVKGKKHKK